MSVGTIYSVKDSNGRVLCHAPSQVKANMDSRRKRAVREGFALMCAAASMTALSCGHPNAGMRGPNGECMMTLGYTTERCNGVQVVRDVVTGAWLPMADGSQRSDDMAVIERGHVVPDESGGAMCPCNLVPENRGSNKGHGKRSLDPRMFRTDDPRKAWFDVWFTHYARPSQRRVAIRP